MIKVYAYVFSAKNGYRINVVVESGSVQVYTPIETFVDDPSIVELTANRMIARYLNGREGINGGILYQKGVENGAEV